MPYHQILVPIDIGTDSDAIGTRAAAFAKTFDAKVTLLHVMEYVPTDPIGEALIPPPVELEAELLEGARARLREFADRVGLSGAPQTACVGNIKAEIIRMATDIDADLIIIGRHQRHGLALFLGSTERSLVTAAPCDVLAVRVPDD